MPIELKVPEVGESITEVMIGTWKKREGDVVAIDDLVANMLFFKNKDARDDYGARAKDMMATKPTWDDVAADVIGFVTQRTCRTPPSGTQT